MKPMEIEIDDAVKNITKTFVGLLVLSVASIFVALILGVGGINIYSDYNTDPQGMGMPLLSGSQDNDFQEINHTDWEIAYVPIAKSCAGSEKTVSSGWINFCIDIPDELPICITDCYLQQAWTMRAFSYGGYTPAEMEGLIGETYFMLDQEKTGKGGKVNVDWVYVETIGFEDFCCTDWWTFWVPEFVCEWYCDIYCWWWICFPWCELQCGWEYDPVTLCIDSQYCQFDVYEAFFSVDTNGGNEAIQLESNDLPVVSSLCGDGCGPNLMVNGPEHLDKNVTVTFSSDWTGCHTQDQVFEII